MIRDLRGNDKGLKIIGNRTKFLNTLLNFEKRKDIQKMIEKTYSSKAYGKNNWTKKYEKWGDRPEITTLYGKAFQEFPKLEELNFDLGIITRLPEFINFLKTNYKGQQINRIRNEFREELGTKIMYRGMRISDEEAENISKNGILANYFNTLKQIKKPLEDFEANFISAYVWNVFEKHLYNEKTRSPLISITEKESIGVALGNHFGKRDKQLQILKMEIPALDIIYFTEHGIKNYSTKNLEMHIKIDENEETHKLDNKVESFIMYKINPEEIIDIYKPDIKTTTWNGKVSKNKVA
ncbi:hypothetical protein K9L97_04385 [Candidatus Woesearchaeota archaeon]|nr:hypothetical protein [Candidatus Woesearchaeota archaeon]